MRCANLMATDDHDNQHHEQRKLAGSDFTPDNSHASGHYATRTNLSFKSASAAKRDYPRCLSPSAEYHGRPHAHYVPVSFISTNLYSRLPSLVTLCLDKQYTAHALRSPERYLRARGHTDSHDSRSCALVLSGAGTSSEWRQCPIGRATDNLRTDCCGSKFQNGRCFSGFSPSLPK